MQASVFYPEDVPGVPTNLLVLPASPSTLRVQVQPPSGIKPLGSNGDPVLGYKIDVATHVAAVQTFSIQSPDGPITGGSYRVSFTNSFGTATSASCIPWDATSDVFSMALQSLTNIDGVFVTRSAFGAVPQGYVYTITFTGAVLANGAQSQLVSGSATTCSPFLPPNHRVTLAGAQSTTAGNVGFVPEVWQLTTSESSLLQGISGTFDLSVGFEGVMTSLGKVVSVNAGAKFATTVANSLVGVVSRGEVISIGGERFRVHATAPFTDTVVPLDSKHIRGANNVAVFGMDTIVGRVSVVQGNPVATTAADYTGVLAVGDSIQVAGVEFTVNAIIATEVTFGLVSDATTTSNWPTTSDTHVTLLKRKKATFKADADPSEVVAGLQSLPGVGSVQVTRVGPTAQRGYQWLMTFLSLGPTTCPHSPCLRLDPHLVNEYAAACITCSAALVRVRAGVLPDFSRLLGSTEIGGAVLEVQSIVVSGASPDVAVVPLGGYFYIDFQSYYQSPASTGVLVKFDDTADDVTTKLQSLPTIGTVTVTRTVLGTGFQWLVTFVSNMGDQPLLTVNGGLLIGTNAAVAVAEVTKGVAPQFEAVLAGLPSSTSLIVRAFAKNAKGYGASSDTMQKYGRGASSLATKLLDTPAAPSISKIWPVSFSQLGISFTPSDAAGGTIKTFRLEATPDAAFGVPHVIAIDISNPVPNDTYGTFQLTYGGRTTQLLTSDASAATVQAAINAMPNLRPVSVTRSLYVFLGTVASQVTAYSATLTTLTTTALSQAHVSLLPVGARVMVNLAEFTVAVVPSVGATTVKVTPVVATTTNFAGLFSMLRTDSSGALAGSFGYRWQVNFPDEPFGIDMLTADKWAVTSSTLASVAGSGSLLSSYAITTVTAPTGPTHYAPLELSTEPWCNTYVVGTSSPTQVVEFFASTTITAGSFALTLGQETTACIAFDAPASGTPTSVKSRLEALDAVNTVSVEDLIKFKTMLLPGSATSKVMTYDSVASVLTLGVGGLTQAQADALPVGTLIRVAKSPWDVYQDYCDFSVGTAAALNDVTLAVNLINPTTTTCASFSGDARTLAIFDMKGYRIVFQGDHSTGKWPTLRVTTAGTAPCAAFSPVVPIRSRVQTIKYEGACAAGSPEVQTVIADADSAMGGTFTLSYRGQVTPPLGVASVSVNAMRAAVQALMPTSTAVSVTTNQHNTFGRAWQITFSAAADDTIDVFVLDDSFVTGTSSEMHLYPAVEFVSTSQANSLRGSFTIALGGEVTGALGCAATLGKVIQALESLNSIYTVLPVANSASDSNQVGFTQLALTVTATAGSNVLTVVKYQGTSIDPSLYVAIGDPITVGAEPHVVIGVSSGDITLDQNMVAGGANVNANAGLLLSSTTPADGVASTLTPTASIVTATVGSPTIVLATGHGWVLNDVVSIGTSSYSVLAVNMDGVTVTLASNYAGPAIVASVPVVFGIKNTLLTTADLGLAAGDKVWYTWTDGSTSEFLVVTSSPRRLTVTGVLKEAIFMGTLRVNGGGFRYPIVFKSISSDLATIDAYPNPDWSGYAARLKTIRPQLVQPYTFTLGNPSQIQTIKLSASTAGAVGTGGTYTLSFRGETTAPIAWAATPAAIKAALELLTVIDGVSVTSLALGNGFMHTLTLWGWNYDIRYLPLLTSAFQVGAGGDATQISIVHHVMQPTYPYTPSWPQYTSLSAATPYILRVVAKNEVGFGLSSALTTASTAMTAVLPSPPRGVTLGNSHGVDWLGVTYTAPKYNGGAAINMYRIEWDASSEFDSTGPDFHYQIVQQQFEVQEVLSSFRSAVGQGGTFTLAFGGFTTNPMPAACTAAQMTAELTSITGNVKTEGSPIKVTRTAVGWGYSWKVTFMANLGNLARLRVDASMLQGDFAQVAVREITPGVQDIVPGDFTYEVQDIYTSAASPLAGTFVLSFHGVFTSPISVSATALEMQRALQALTTIYSAKVTKTVLSPALQTAVWSVTFAHVENNVLVGSGNIFRMIVESTALTSGTLGSVAVAERVKGTNPFQFRATGLVTGTTYYVRVMAYNSQGFGSNSSPFAAGVPRTQPGPPSNVVTTVQDSTTLHVAWGPPSVTGGALVDQYKVEWFRAPGLPVEQTITTSATRGIQEIQQITSFASTPSLGGYFKLTYQGYTTANIAWNALATGAGSVKERLERIPTLGAVYVSRTTSLTTVANLFVILATTTTAVAQAPITDVATCCGFAIGNTLVVAGQTRTIAGLAAGGTTITLSADAATTTVPVQVYRSANGFQWTITFGPMHVGDVLPLIVTPSDNWGGSSPGIYVSTVQDGIAPIGGTFRLTVPLSVNGVIMSEQTPALPFDISGADMKVALESLSTVSVVDVTRSVNGYGFNWFVKFSSESATDVQLIAPDGEGLTGPSVAIAASITQPGTPPTLYCEASGVAGTCHGVSATLGLSDAIPQLVTGVPYMTRVRAHSIEGWGLAAWGQPQYEIPRGVPSAPRNVQLMSLSSTQLKVVWTTPSSSGGSLVSSFRIEWDTTATFANIGVPGFDYFNIFAVPAGNLGPYYFNIPVSVSATYFVRVFASNDRGLSPPAGSVPSSLQPNNMPPGTPQSPKLVVLSSTGYLVSWLPPSTALTVFGGPGGLPITQYMVEWDTASTFDSPASYAMVAGDQSEFIIGGRNVLTGVQSPVLTPGGTYFVRVTAFNGLGASPTAPTVPPSLLLANQLPWVPQALTLTDVSASSVLGQWTTPKYDGGLSVRKYTFQYDQQSDYMSGSMQSVDVPIVHEVQTLWLATDPISEEQNIEATVQVTNERQTVRTTVTGVDEVQVVTTSCDNVVDEVQTITTTATDRNEVQTIVLDGTDVNEVQAVRTTLVNSAEVQTITIGVVRVFEVQSFTLGFTGITTPASITGDLILGLDTMLCTFCTVQMVLQPVTVTTAVVDPIDTSGASKMELLLASLANVDVVTVTRLTTVDTLANTLTMVFTVTFSGVEVAGNVPAMTLQSSLAPLIPLTSVQTVATEVQSGSQPVYNAASQFKLYYTCEQYSDPTQKIGLFAGISAGCQPTTQLCATCATSFDGTDVTVNMDLTAAVAVGAVLQIGPCVYGIASRTATKLTVDTTNVGKFCSPFIGKALPVYIAQVYPAITNLVIRRGSGSVDYPEQDSVIAGQFLNTLGKSVTVVGNILVTNTFVGSTYAVTFSSHTGTIPLLKCDVTSMAISSGTRSCTVARTAVGSMIYGSFVMSLARMSDGVVFPTTALPFDVSEADLTTALQAVGSAAEWVFGTVAVTRNAFPITGSSRWYGGYTWQITFLSRGWNIPTLTVDSTLLLNAQAATPVPVVVIEDGSNLMTPPAGSVHGNQIGGSFLLSYNGVAATAPCVLGTNTDATSLTTGPTNPDTLLETYLKAQFGFASISVYRSLPTQARGFTWFVTFVDKDTGGDVPPLVIVSSAGLTGTGVTLTNDELVKGNQISGTFQLQYNGQTTGPILYSASDAEVAEQINSLDSIRPSTVVVTRTGPYGPSTGVADVTTQVLGYQWSVTFRSSVWKDPTSDHSVMTPGNWIGPPATWTDVWETGYSKAWGRQVGPLTAMGLQIACLPQALTSSDGSASCSVVTATPGVGPLKGTFRLQLDSGLNPYMKQGVAQSVAIAHNAWGSAVQSRSSGTSMEEILEGMLNIGNVAVTRGAVNVLTGGYAWTITFLNDKEPCVEHDSLTGQCNSPGNVPPLTVFANTLIASNPAITICEASTTNCGVNADGVILRSDLSVFKVTGDPGVEHRFLLDVTCQGATGGSTCAALVGGFVINTPSPALATTLLAGDRFFLVGYSTCVFTVLSITPTFLDVVNQACVPMQTVLTGGPFPLTIVLPWNAQENQVLRVVQAASDTSLETGLWSGGRKISVQKTVIGKYGAVSWLIRFIANPGMTPPGAGNINPLDVQFLTFDRSGASATELQQLVLTSNAPVVNGLQGLFRLAFKNNGATATTGCLNYGLSASALQTALNGLSNVMTGHIVVTRTGDGTAAWGYGYQYQIAFSGNLHVGTSNVLGNVHQLDIFSVGQDMCAPLVTGLPSIQVKTIRGGKPRFSYDVFFVGKTFGLVDPLTLVQEGTCTGLWTQVGGSSRRIEVQVIDTGSSPEIQDLVVQDSTTAITGTPSFKLSYMGATTAACIPFNAGASAIQAALIGLSTIGAGGVLVSQDTPPLRAPNGFLNRITFVGDTVAGNVNSISVVYTGCTVFAATSSVTVVTRQDGGGTGNKIALSTQYSGDQVGSIVAYAVSQTFRVLDEKFQVDQIVVSNPNNDIAAPGTYTLTLGGVTTAVLWNAQDTEMEVAFGTGLGVVGGVTVTRRTDATVAPGGFVYTIYYLQSLGSLGALTQANTFTTATVAITNSRAGSNTNLFTSSVVPLALVTDSTTPASFVGAGTGLSVFKANGFQWSVLFDSNIGNVPALLGQSSSGLPVTVYDDFIQGSLSNSVTVTDLVPGIPYYMEVSASTAIGQSAFSASATIIPSSVATSPRNFVAGYDLFVSEIQVVKTAARHVLEVQTVTTTAAVISEVQTLTTTAGQCNNCLTGNIAYRQPTVQVVSISALAPILGGTFQLVHTDTAASGTGTFTHTMYTTTALGWSSTAAQVAAALVATTAFGSSDIVVTREGDATVGYNYGYVFSITFVGNAVAGEVLPLILRDTTTTPACGTCTAFTTLGGVGYTLSQSQNVRSAMGTDTAVQRVIVKADQVLFTGGYQLSLTNAGAAQQSGCIPFNTAAADLETLLEAMPNIDKVYVERSLDAVVAPNGYIFDLFFYGQGVTRYHIPALVVTMGCTAFQTLANNVLSTAGVNAAVTVTYVHENAFADPTGFRSAASTPAQLQADLTRLPIVGSALYVSRSLQDNQGGFKWTIVFDQEDGNVPLFICGSDAAFQAVVGSQCSVESVIDGNVLSGSFMLGASDPIPFNADETTMANALQQLSWLGSVAVTRTGPTGQLGYTWTLSFLTYQGALPVLLATNLMNGIGSSIQVVETVRGNALTGTFQLGFRGTTTTPIAYNAAAMAVGDGSSMQEKLQALSTIGALNINRIGPDFEGGYEWWITFTDDIKTGGDLPPLTPSNMQLGATGAVVNVREVLKGSMGSGNRLWVSFDPPTSDNGDPVSGYGIQWDTSNTFIASPQRYVLQDSQLLFYRQKIISTAPSLAWSSTLLAVQSTIQSIAVDAASTTFTLSFKGVTTSAIVVGMTSLSTVQTLLNGLSTIQGGVTLSPLVGLVTASTSFAITFTGQYGPQPVLVSSDTNNVVSTVQVGVTNYRKEVLAFSCAATAGTITITAKTMSKTFPFNTLLTEVEAGLETLLGAPAGSITVTTPSQAFVCAAVPQIVTITFHRTYGALASGVTASGGPVLTLSDMTTAGIYVNPVTAMSGTFYLAFQGTTTPPLNSQSAALDLRIALETLPSIQTVSVSRTLSYQPVTGKVDVQQGQLYVTCSFGETCNFAALRYGVPGTAILIGGGWYTVVSDVVSADMPTSQLYLGDMNNNPIAYQGDTATGVTVYEWAKGYVWTVDMLLLAPTSTLSMLRPRQVNLTPVDGKVMVQGDSCQKCYYIPDQTTAPLLTMGATYYLQADAVNTNGKSPTTPLIQAVPRQIPDAPNAINIVVVSGTQVEVFFSPPNLAPARVAPSYNNDITTYIIQWDTATTFKHGLPACRVCATSFTGSVVSVSSDLTAKLAVGKSVTVGNMNCVLTITALDASTLTVAPNACAPFLAQAYDVLYYIYPPAVLSGLPIQGTPPYRYLIQSLTIATTYYVRIAAVNSVPVQSIAVSGSPPYNRRWTFPSSVTTNNVLPDPPIAAYLYVISGTSLEVQIQPALRDGQGLGGGAITAYSIDVDTVSTFSTPGRAYPVDVPIASFTLLYPGGPYTYYITGLTTGTPYFVQVKAKTTVGYSRATIATNTLAPTCTSGPPTQVAVSTIAKLTTAPISTAVIQWGAPLALGGLPLRYFHVEWWTAASRAEVQVVELKWTLAPTALSFTLAFGGALSGGIPFDASPANLRNALMNIGGTTTPAALPIGNVQVTRTAINVNQGYQWTVTFVSTLRNLPMLQLSVATTTGGAGIQSRVFEAVAGVAGGATTSPGTPEVQVLTLTHPTAAQAITGFFRASFMGSSWSTYIPATASATFVQNVLQELFTIGRVTVNPITSANFPANTIAWAITFNSIVGNVPALTVDATKLLPATSVARVYDGNNVVLPTGAWCTTLDLVCQAIYTYVRIGEQAVDYGFYDTNVPTVLTYTVMGLTTGTSYYMSVTAANALGLGPRAASFPASIIPPKQVPSQPTSVTVNVNYGISTQLLGSWSTPRSDGGSSILKYTVEYDTSPAFSTRASQDVWCATANIKAVWRISLTRVNVAQTAAVALGWFKLKLTRSNSITTSDPIPFNAVPMGSDELGAQPAMSLVYCTACATCTDTCDAAKQGLSGSLQYKIQALQDIAGVVVTRSAQQSDGGYVWSITFQDDGDDFAFEPVASVQALNCAGGTCANTDYQVAAVKVTSGVKYPSCIGTQVLPATGALTKGQLYYVRVSAFNSIGFSFPQLAPNPQKPMVVPGLPTGVSLQVNSVSSLKVVFSPPNDNGGDTITSYQVTWSIYSDFHASSTTQVTLLSGGAPYFCLIPGLTKGQFYYVQVAAQNSQGTGIRVCVIFEVFYPS
ncbi:hypothetical protein DYB26_000715 [Aphanomyces astaci]|uniref:Fibronectin type-III domain-containing protein n=2 Tax=Aphanomyces astaci TaxID=112090 RepID=A0A3R7DVC8_APHAT|nr:hypothetical protein DYB26_000715 [Aphanomyces astaci]